MGVAKMMTRLWNIGPLNEAAQESLVSAASFQYEDLKLFIFYESVPASFKCT